MTAAKETKIVNVCGDILRIIWDGNCWVSPSNGQQHSSAQRAMMVEIRELFSASGDDTEDDEVLDRMDGYLTQMVDG